ncbi:OmpH family outer membrane protein [Sphingosinithalassobacter sp. LHW66-3]|uniref:OmpH family outer membrane protein n=1 Tax=Sphingosinithalassobacter sp. LHW66-3 TaxID=3424718 RepID=UPI003D6C1126
MKSFATALTAALVSASAVAVAVPAAAQTAPGIGVVNLPEVVQRSAAYQAAMQQIQTTYAAQIQQAQQRRQAIQTELQPQVQAFQQAQQAQNADRQALTQQYQAIQQREQAAQQELNTILQPVALAQAYAEEQVVAQLEAAVDRVMQNRQLAIVLRPDSAVKFLPSVNVTQDVVNELNTALPSVSTTPPAGWQPGGEQQQQQAAPQAQPQGR